MTAQLIESSSETTPIAARVPQDALAAGLAEETAPQAVIDEKGPATAFDSEPLDRRDPRTSAERSEDVEKGAVDDLETKDESDVASKVDRLPSDETDYPDGGWGWVIVLCSFWMSVIMWGANSAFGVFLSFFLANDYYPGATELEFAFIGGMSISMAMLCGPISNWCSKRYGVRFTMAIGGFLLSGGQILSGFTTRIWELFLTQSVCFGFGLGFLMVSLSPVVSTWFGKKRALALGIVGGGSGAGGLLFSNLNRWLIENRSLRWAYVTDGLIAVVVLIPSITLIKTRAKPLKVGFEPFKLSLFTNYGFVALVAWGIFIQLAYTIGLYSIPVYATTALGLSQTQGAAIQSLLSAGQLVLRPTVGFMLDRIGRINGAAITTVVAGLSCLLIWMFAESFAALAVFAIIQGGSSGIFWTSNNALLTEVLGIRELNTGLSMLWLSIVLPATVAEPIALELVNYSRRQGRDGTDAFTYSIAFAGTMFVTSGLSLLVAKRYKQGNWRWLRKT